MGQLYLLRDVNPVKQTWQNPARGPKDWHPNTVTSDKGEKAVILFSAILGHHVGGVAADQPLSLLHHAPAPQPSSSTTSSSPDSILNSSDLHRNTSSSCSTTAAATATNSSSSSTSTKSSEDTIVRNVDQELLEQVEAYIMTGPGVTERRECWEKYNLAVWAVRTRILRENTCRRNKKNVK